MQQQIIAFLLVSARVHMRIQCALLDDFALHFFKITDHVS